MPTSYDDEPEEVDFEDEFRTRLEGPRAMHSPSMSQKSGDWRYKSAIEREYIINANQSRPDWRKVEHHKLRQKMRELREEEK